MPEKRYVNIRLQLSLKRTACNIYKEFLREFTRIMEEKYENCK